MSASSTEEGKVRPAGYYLLRPHEQEMADTLIEAGFSKKEAIAEVVALAEWARHPNGY
jgi:hypothetical protein